MMVIKKIGMLFSLLVMLMVVNGCLVEIEHLPTRTLVPGVSVPTMTALPITLTATPIPTITATPSPTATPKPVTFTVGERDDMFSIALYYGISLDELKAANPDVNPNAMGVGTVLIIPIDPNEAEEFLPENATQNLPTLNWQGAAGIKGEAACYPTVLGGTYCLAEVENQGEEALENVSVLFMIFDQNDRLTAEMTAFTPLNVLDVDGVLPVMAYLPEDVPEGGRIEAEVNFWLPMMPEDDRYALAQVTDQQIEFDGKSLVAEVSGEIAVEADDRELASLWLLVVAYDQKGVPVGLRRWEADLPLNRLKKIPFETYVYSLDGPIDSIRFLVESRFQTP